MPWSSAGEGLIHNIDELVSPVKPYIMPPIALPIILKLTETASHGPSYGYQTHLEGCPIVLPGVTALMGHIRYDMTKYYQSADTEAKRAITDKI